MNRLHATCRGVSDGQLQRNQSDRKYGSAWSYASIRRRLKSAGKSVIGYWKTAVSSANTASIRLTTTSTSAATAWSRT